MLTPIAADIYQLRLPLPFKLDHVQVYLLRDGDSWTVVDTGLNTSAARAVWQAAWAELNSGPHAIGRIILTHTHPDHYGLAGWLQAAADNRPAVWLSARERELARLTWLEMDAHMPAWVAYFRACGLPEGQAATVAEETRRTARHTAPHPTRLETLTPGRPVAIGERVWLPILAPGHSDGQLLLYDADDKLLLCGDHVLLTITPHIGYWESAEANPLPRFLASLVELRALDVRLALPGHRAAIADWRGRLEELEQHHAVRLQETLAVVTADCTVAQVAQAVFRLDDLNTHEVRFAVAETRSHLELLVDAGRLVRAPQTPWRYTRA